MTSVLAKDSLQGVAGPFRHRYAGFIAGACADLGAFRSELVECGLGDATHRLRDIALPSVVPAHPVADFKRGRFPVRLVQAASSDESLCVTQEDEQPEILAIREPLSGLREIQIGALKRRFLKSPRHPESELVTALQDRREVLLRKARIWSPQRQTLGMENPRRLGVRNHGGERIMIPAYCQLQPQRSSANEVVLSRQGTLAPAHLDLGGAHEANM